MARPIKAPARPIADLWRISGEVVGAVYAVEAALVSAESRGRGPRPPERIREPRKVAMLLTTMLAECEYAHVARELGLHKDTVTSQVAEMRDRMAEDDEFEKLVEIMLAAVETAARLQPIALAKGRNWRAQVSALEVFMRGCFAQALAVSSDEARASSDTSSVEMNKSRTCDDERVAA